VRPFGSTEGDLQLLRCGQYILDKPAKTFMAPGNRAAVVTQSECDLMVILMQAMGRPVSIDHIMSKMYAHRTDEPDDSTIRTFLSKVRKKLREAGIADVIRSAGSNGYYIENDRSDLDVRVFDRRLLAALADVLAFSAFELPDQVALLRRKG
jgi:DNA-binding response OmpR family regulator